MHSWELRLIQRFEFHDSPAITLHRDVEVPFVPCVDISIGLDYSSAFRLDETRLKRVMYLLERGYFLGELEVCRFAKGTCVLDVLKDSWGKDWELHIDSCWLCETQEEAIEASMESGGERKAVRTIDGYAAMNPTEILFMRICGTEYAEIVSQ